MTSNGRTARGLAGALVALSLIAAAGCGSDDDKHSDNTNNAAVSATTTGGDASSPTSLAADYKGTFGSFPTSAPKPKTGASVWVISLNEASPGVHSATLGILDGAKTLGWQTRVVDTKGAPGAATAGIKQAAAAKANAIVLNVIECGVVESAAKQARAAGIKIVAMNAADCDAPNVKHEPIFDAAEGFTPGGWYPFLRQLGAIRARWTLSQLAGSPGKVLVVHQTDNDGLGVLDQVFTAAVKRGCAKCDVVEVPFVYSDLNTQLKGKVQAALVKNPDAKVMVFPFDATLALGGAAAIQGGGQAGKLKVMGGECAASTVELIRSGTVTACVGNPYNWVGWQVVDDLNRILAGSPQAAPSVGMQLVDKDHNLPAPGKDYTGPGTDYAGSYKKIWAAAS